MSGIATSGIVASVTDKMVSGVNVSFQKVSNSVCRERFTASLKLSISSAFCAGFPIPALRSRTNGNVCPETSLISKS
jgi:hypothetical protein